MAFRRGAFTLVELLVVIVIIGMLGALTLTAVQSARLSGRRTVILAEIKQLKMKLEEYKNEVGEYPPDMSYINDPDPDRRDAAKAKVNRHLRKRFPRYTGDWDDAVNDIQTNYSSISDASQLDQASALMFWLCGLPETDDATHPAGFHADPTDPFKPGTPRNGQYFEISADDERFELLDSAGSVLKCNFYPAAIPETPYVYFRAERHRDTNRPTYLFTYPDPTTPTDPAIELTRYWEHPNRSSDPTFGWAVPYRREGLASGKAQWTAEETYQIITGGLQYRLSNPSDEEDALTFPVAKTGENFEKGDFDNLTSFADGELEDDLQ